VKHTSKLKTSNSIKHTSKNISVQRPSSLKKKPSASKLKKNNLSPSTLSSSLSKPKILLKKSNKKKVLKKKKISL